MVALKCPDGAVCPIEPTLDLIGKKWSLNVIRDLFLGKKRFKSFLENNPDLSTKMLAERLKNLERQGILEKEITSKSPLIIEYSLTRKGRALNKVIYEVAKFSLDQCPDEVMNKKICSKEKVLSDMKKNLGIN